MPVRIRTPPDSCTLAPAFRLDVDEGHLWKGDKVLTLRRTPFAILAYLATNPRRLVTRGSPKPGSWSARQHITDDTPDLAAARQLVG